MRGTNVWRPIRASGGRVARPVLALLAAVMLLTGALNVRFAFGDERAWEVDPAAPSAVDGLVGAAARRSSRLDAQILAA